MVYTGTNSYIYWGVEGTKGAGDPSADQNIPFNPFSAVTPPKPKLIDEVYHTFDKLEPKFVVTNEQEPGEGPFESVFKDPFLLASFFTHKTVGGSWGTGDGTLAFDFSDIDDVDTIFTQYRIRDQVSTNHVDKLLKYGLPMEYHWIIEPGKLLKETASFKFLDFATNTQAPSINNNFHDQSFGSGIGGWANWDNSGLASNGCRSATGMLLKWGGAELTGLKIQNMDMMLKVGSETTLLQPSLVHSADRFSTREFSLTLTGKLNDLTLIPEYEAIYASRTKQTLQLFYDTAVGYEKYIQVTNAFISPESDIPGIPEAGEDVDVSLIIKGGEEFAASFAGTYLNLPDPTALITTSP
jgi:hypothetical protein